jgi:predicted aspartyl protease
VIGYRLSILEVRMMEWNAIAAVVARSLLRACAVVLIVLPAESLFAATCDVVVHKAPSEADKALLAADYDKAAGLYRAALATHPDDADLTVGLVHALLRHQKVQDAADTVRAALAGAPRSAALISLRGEVELRQGEPWTASQSASESSKIDPCNPRNLLLYVQLSKLSSRYATARAALINAHQLDPQDPEIRQEWIETLPLKERIPEIEAYLSAPTGDDADDLRHLRMYLEHLKKLAAEPQKRCHLVSNETSAEIPFVKLMYDATHVDAFGLDVKLNNATARLQIDTGASGLLVTRSAAQRAGLKSFSQTEVGGIGDKGEKPSYIAYADSIRIGNLEFQDCTVEVLGGSDVLENGDGLIGMDVFSRFLVTLDYPMHKLLLGPLPARPGETAGAAPALNTEDAHADDTDAPAGPGGQQPRDRPEGSQPDSATAGSTTPSAALPSSAKPATHGPYDRYIAPEMKDYTPVYRAGHDLILPASLNGDKPKLFIMDTGAFATSISPEAARGVTRVHRDSDMEVQGISGKVDKVYSAAEITFRFAHVSQNVRYVVSFDTSHISRDVGMEISGFIGATTLSQLTIHIDYRDGLVKFDYDPYRGYKF